MNACGHGADFLVFRSVFTYTSSPLVVCSAPFQMPRLNTMEVRPKRPTRQPTSISSSYVAEPWNSAVALTANMSDWYVST